MRIVVTFPQRLEAPGGGSVGCRRIAESLAALGAEVEVLTVDRGDKMLPEPYSIRVRRARPSRLHYLLDGLKVARELGRYAPGSVDWLVGWSTEAAWLPAVARRLGARFGMILAMPSYRSWFQRDTSFRWVKRWIDRYFRIRPPQEADLVFALSRFSKAEIVEVMGLPSERVVVSYWGVDPCFFGVSRKAGPDHRVLFFGSLAPIKGVLDAVAACGLVARRGIGFELRIAGWGDWETVRRAVAEASIEARVTYLGTLDRDGLCQELAQASVALLPSRAESFGLAIAEA